MSQLALSEAAKGVFTSGALLVLSLLGTNLFSRAATLQVALVFGTVAAVSRIWGHVASHFVPEPYLDEVFHILQVQKYCEGRYWEWDDKITTPPGLYILSLTVPKNVFTSRLSAVFGCDTESLRGVNAFCLGAIAYLALRSRQQLEACQRNPQRPATFEAPSGYAIHSALNIALCPIIFFFSGLYYTDVASAAAVLAAFLNSLERMATDQITLQNNVYTIALGLTALSMRQTNVFWVVVFTGGLEAVHAVKAVNLKRVHRRPESTALGRVRRLAVEYSDGYIHDPPLNMAWPDDMFFTVLSLVVAGICNLPRVLKQVWPHLAVLGAFASFVVWNEGVVLGDKSNHVATLHMAQMLYIWPLFAFFSLPLLAPYMMYPAVMALGAFPLAKRHGRSLLGEDHQAGRTSPKDSSSPRQHPDAIACKSIFSSLCSVAALGLSIVIVKYNTIIHPFTLADNRHYMFYVFRYTIRRAGWIRYALVAAYAISRWVVWQALAGHTSGEEVQMRDTEFINHPLMSDVTATEEIYVQAEEKTSHGGANNEDDDDASAIPSKPVSTSTALLFLVATALSLITAPLVEPRYFIVPWVMWRLLIPAWRPHQLGQLPREWEADVAVTLMQRVADGARQYDLRLVTETLWFLAVNVGTICIFLFKPYQWRAEDGSLLDEGRSQRFMW